MKKGQGLSVQTIVIVALALLVLIILAIFIATRTTESSEKIEKISALDIRTRCFGDHAQDLEAYNKCVEDCKKNPTKERCKPLNEK